VNEAALKGTLIPNAGKRITLKKFHGRHGMGDGDARWG